VRPQRARGGGARPCSGRASATPGGARCRTAGRRAPTRVGRGPVLGRPVVFVVSAATAALALTAAPDAAAQALRNNHFTVDLFQGPILAPISIMGVAGAYSPVAEGISGFGSNAASPAVREPYTFNSTDFDVSGSVSIPLPLFENDDFDDSGSRDQSF